MQHDFVKSGDREPDREEESTVFEAVTCKRVQVGLRFGLALTLLLGLSACEEFEGVDRVAFDHPANPAARSGKQVRLSKALMPENSTVQPELPGLGSARPAVQKPMRMDHTMNHRGSH